MTGYHRPSTLAGALDLLATHGAQTRLLAGGTALMLPERRHQIDEHLLALHDIPELHAVRLDAGGTLHLGALSTHSALARSRLVQRICPALGAAFARIANVRVRNQATLGGNLALADPAHDPPAILIALNARALLARSGVDDDTPDMREVDVQDLADGPGRSTLAAEETLVEVRIPPTGGLRVVHRKFLMRAGSFRDQASYPTVSVGVALIFDSQQRCTQLRIGLSGVHRHPCRATATETALLGHRLTPAAIHDAAAAVRDDLDPADDERGSPGYKRDMAAVWIERALLAAVALPPPPYPNPTSTSDPEADGDG